MPAGGRRLVRDADDEALDEAVLEAVVDAVLDAVLEEGEAAFTAA